MEFNEGTSRKIFVDTGDKNDVSENLHKWCDVYAKINLDPKDTSLPKILAIGPSFGVQIWNPIITLFLCLKHYFAAKKCEGFVPPLRYFLKNYSYTFIRRTYFGQYKVDIDESDDDILVKYSLV